MNCILTYRRASRADIVRLAAKICRVELLVIGSNRSFGIYERLIGSSAGSHRAARSMPGASSEVEA